MRYKIKLSTLLLICYLIISCNSDDQNVPPSVVTGSSQVLSEGGVILNGDFQNFNSNAVLGFEVYNYSIGSFINVEVSNATNGANAVQITTGLYINEEYKYRAYIQTASETYYGLEETFLSAGSAEASFLTISPNQGDFKDAVEIVSDVELDEAYINDIVVLFSGEEAGNISMEGNTIVCEVPYYDGDPLSEIQINYFGSLINTSLTYQLLPPIIETVSPNNVTYRDEVVITGDHFEDNNPQYLNVFVDGISATIIERSKTALTIRIPDEVVSVNPIIKVESNLQEVEVENAITMKVPVITSYPTSGYIFDTIDIFVDNISPVYFNNSVYFDGVLADTYQPSDGSTNRIAVQIPQGPYADWNPTITIKTSEQLESIEYPFTILDATIEVSDEADVPINNYQVFNDDIYVYGFTPYNSTALVINKYSESDNMFYDEHIVNMPVSDNAEIINSNDGFIYLHYNRIENNFFRVNLSNYSLESLDDLPEGTKSKLITAFNTDDIVIGLGDSNSSQGNFYKYTISNDNWELMNATFTMPIHKNFYSENESYYIQGVYSVASDVYRFNDVDYTLIADTFPLEFRDYTRPPYIFREDKFYFFKDFGNTLNSNPMMVFDTTNYSWTELFDVLPNDDYSITGMFYKGNFIYLQIIDYSLDYHVLKLDLSSI